MSTIVEAHVPAEQFALAHTLEVVPDAEFRMVRTVDHGSDGAMPLLWARTDDADGLTDALERDETAAGTEVLAEFEAECLVRVEWEERLQVLLYIVGEEDATVLDALGRGDAWHLQIFFPEHESVSATYDFCQEYGIDVSFERICNLDDAGRSGDVGLTREQYQAIAQAYEAGYYDVPRRINQEELAEAFGVSHQALSERLRRGHQTVVANMLYRNFQRPDSPVATRMSTGIDG